MKFPSFSFIFRSLLLILPMTAVVLIACSKDSEPQVVIPKISLTATSLLNEGDGGTSQAAITINLSEATTAEIRFKFSTTEASALATLDFTPVVGEEVIIEPGLLYKSFNVNIVADDGLELDEYFFVTIQDAVNATIGVNTAKITILNDDNYTVEQAEDGPITPDNYPGMALIWSDEFDGTTINLDNWKYNEGGGGWGNNELETYTSSSENSFVQDGKLHIVATKTGSSTYRSARMISQGKQEFTYGRIDIRAKMPYGQGIWPALWMLGANISSVSWPKCGEIDIMEYLGHDTQRIYGTLHYDQNGHAYKGSSSLLTNGEGYDDKFHVFTIIWQDNSIKWYVDYKRYFEATPNTVDFTAFNLPQFFIMNVAVGGNWPGNPDATTVFPQTMLVDYVRVFQ